MSPIEIHRNITVPNFGHFAWLVVVKNEGLRFLNQVTIMANLKPRNVDIIVVDGNSNDGSTDSDTLFSIGVHTLIKSDREEGFSSDLQLGLSFVVESGYRGVVSIDGNGKDSCEDINKFINLLEQGYDFIQGSRFASGGRHRNTPKLRLVGIKLFASPITSLFAGFRITDPTNGFRAYSKSLLECEFLGLNSLLFPGYSLVPHLAVVAGRNEFRYKEIGVERSYPEGIVPSKIVKPSQWLSIFFDLFRAGFVIFPKKGL